MYFDSSVPALPPLCVKCHICSQEVTSVGPFASRLVIQIPSPFRHICEVRATGFTSKTSLLLVVLTVLSIMEKMTQLSNAKTLSLESKTDCIFEQLSSRFLTLICAPAALLTWGPDDCSRWQVRPQPWCLGTLTSGVETRTLASFTVFAYVYLHESLKEKTLVSLCDSRIYYHANMYSVPINISEK